VAVDRVGEKGRVVGIDLLAIDAIPGAELIQMDFMDDAAPDLLKRLLDGPADLVLSDMAASATGHSQTDHLRIIALADAAYDFAKDVLKPHGAFVAKVLQGGATGELLVLLKRDFAQVKHVKPPASRSDSAEIYVVALGFRG
jgi:23S rRNA (uridine2552-2'-O)-methyltransferase